jgi:histone deacetylase complex regulatory component SIN3
MISFCSLDTPTAAARIQHLFQNHPGLLESFNHLFSLSPQGNQIEEPVVNETMYEKKCYFAF